MTGINLRLQIGGLEQVESAARAFPKESKSAVKSAMGSVGYHIKKDLTDYGKQGRAGKWKRKSQVSPALSKGHRARRQRSIETKRYKRGQRKGQIRPKRSPSGAKGLAPMGRLVNASSYKVYENPLHLEVGFLSKSAAALVLLHGKRRRIRVTPKMRRFFFAVGVPLDESTQSIQRPARPWFSPVRRQWTNDKVSDLFEEKFTASLNRQLKKKGLKIEY
jgi:hypothetical protein